MQSGEEKLVHLTAGKRLLVTTQRRNHAYIQKLTKKQTFIIEAYRMINKSLLKTLMQPIHAIIYTYTQ